MRKSRAENLLALFTSSENAASIVGDLTELSATRSRGWFVREVIRLALVFWMKSLFEAPARALCYAGLGLGVYLAVYAGLFVVSGLPWYPWHRVHEPGFVVRLCMVIFASNLLTGTILAQTAPSRASRAIASLAALWLAAWFISSLVIWRAPGSFAPWLPLIRWPWTIVLVALLFPLLYLLPLLAGAVIAQRRPRPTSAIEE